MEIITQNAIVTYPVILSALVEAIKRTGVLQSKWMPFVAIILALIGGYFLEIDWLNSIVVALTSVGLYEGAKGTITEVSARL